MRKVVISLLCSLAACSPEEPTPELEQVASSEHALYGDTQYAADCTADMRSALDTATRYGRVVTASPAFQQCMTAAVTTGYAGIGPYRQCYGDPFYGESPAEQIDGVLDITHSPNDLAMTCTGGPVGANAAAGLGVYGHEDAEAFQWSDWLRVATEQLKKPVCGTPGATSDCRFAPSPWPYSQMAEVIWHEAMHTQQYTHGANNQADAKVSCGYAGQSDAYFHFQRNTMPYIVGSCIAQVLKESAAVCGQNLDVCDGHGLALEVGLGATACSCHEDPAPAGLGMVSLRGPALSLDDKAYDGERMGSWLLSTANDTVRGAGDFNGDGRADVVVTSAWGIGVVGKNTAGKSIHVALAPWGTTVGTWKLAAGQTVAGIGDFNGDGRADLLLVSSTGKAILTVVSGNFAALSVVANGQATGDWVHSSDDLVVRTADLNGDARPDLLVRSKWGIGVLTMNTAGKLTSANLAAFGTWIGGWRLEASNLIGVGGTGDFDGDQRQDFVVRSAWGVGVLGRNANGTLTSLALAANGSKQGDWTMQPGDVVRGIGDLNGDGRAELVVSTGAAIGALSRTTTGGFDDLAIAAMSTWVGGWYLGASDGFQRVADLNADGRAEIVVKSTWGMGVLRVSPAGVFTSQAVHPFGDLIGSWVLGGDNDVQAVADFDGDGDNDLLMRQK